jgi:hypothetical protein
MKRLIVIVSICFLGMVSSAHGQERYRSDKLKFSFVLPEGWERTPYDKLSDHYKFSWDTVREKMTAMELFSVRSSGSLDTPYIYFEGIIDTTQSEVEKEERYLPYIAREHEYIENHQKFWQRDIDWLQTGKRGGAPKSWKGAELIGTDFYYDQEKHAKFKTIELYHERVGKILYENIRLMGSRRYVSLSCYWDGENPDEFLDLLDGIMDSFSYDKGYGFSETVGVVSAYKQKVSRKKVWLLLTVGIPIAIFLLYRWADR